MKALIIISLVGLALSSAPVLSEEEQEVMPLSAIDFINSVQSQWKASKSWVGSMTRGQARGYASSERLPYIEDQLFEQVESKQRSFPWNFDARNAWPGCTIPILDQGQCGSCWAFAAIGALSDRICIASLGATQVVLSPQYLVSCDSNNYGCDGGYLGKAWNFMRQGVPTNTCVSYKAVDGTCPTTCDDGSALEKYKVGRTMAYKGPKAIMAAIISGGPVETGFDVYEDFMSYSTGIYAHTVGGLLGGHAVKIVGWGKTQGVDYWICANSWGTSWGMQGFFNIQFGQC